MKKLLTMVAVLATACVMFLGCPQEATTDEGPAPAFTITYNASAQYAAPAFKVADDWASIAIEFAEDYSKKIQFCVTTDKEAGPASWDPNTMTYVCTYPAAPKSSAVDFKAIITAPSDDGTLADKGATKVTNLSIQNVTADGFKVKVISAKVTKVDGSVVDVVPTGDWGSSVK